MADYDYDLFVIGAGSAGCVLADRLSADGQSTVLVLEAGNHDRRLWINMPIGYGKTFYDERVNWKFDSQPEAQLKGRRIYFPRGRVVGGSSSINAMVYCRGLSADFDDWAQMGNPGWAWNDVQPVYQRFERPVDADGVAGPGGALFVSDVRQQLHPTERHFFAAASRRDCRSPKTSTGRCQKVWGATGSTPAMACAGRAPTLSCARRSNAGGCNCTPARWRKNCCSKAGARWG